MRERFEPDCYYHVFNHANGNENLFRCKDNYRYFLEKYATYIQPVARTFCYCLMPNHFHLLVGIRSEQELVRDVKNLTGFGNLSGLVEQPFSNFFNSYAKSFNRKYHRKGSLFNRPFKRKKIASDDYLTKIIHYIHYNPVHHGFTKNIENWPYSSYKTIFSDKPTLLYRETVLQWIGGRKEFVQFHQQIPDLEISKAFEPW